MSETNEQNDPRNERLLSHTSSHVYIACDLGAESGRVILGVLQGGILTLEEVYRFPTGPLPLGESLRWTCLRSLRR